MRIINTRVHGILDYLVSLIVIASPWIFNFAHNGAETWVPVIIGVFGILYSLMTNYEFGAVKVFRMPTHLALDIGSGIILATSPWIFGFYDLVSTPHLVLGLLEVGVAVISDRVPYQHQSTSASHRPTH